MKPFKIVMLAKLTFFNDETYQNMSSIKARLDLTQFLFYIVVRRASHNNPFEK